jgi:hypothetical protein
MKPKKTARKEPTADVSAADFPALRQFLRGYLHEDWREEYDSAADAARQFAEDADACELRQVAEEWQRFREHTKNWSLAAINDVLSGTLGGSWRVTDPSELDAVSLVLRP